MSNEPPPPLRPKDARAAERRTEETSRDAPQAREAVRQVMQAGQAGQLPFPEGGMTKEVLRAEADRIVFAAARIGEEARIAAESAERKLAVAKLAERASSIAVEAVNLLATAGLSEAARRFQDARALDQQVQTEVQAMPSLNPPPVSARARGFGAAGADAPASTRAPGGYGIPPAIPSQPPVPPGWTPPREAPDDLASKLRPQLFGLPQPVAFAVLAGVVVFLIVVILIASG
jgi:hypothetical protein